MVRVIGTEMIELLSSFFIYRLLQSNEIYLQCPHPGLFELVIDAAESLETEDADLGQIQRRSVLHYRASVVSLALFD